MGNEVSVVESEEAGLDEVKNEILTENRKRKKVTEHLEVQNKRMKLDAKLLEEQVEEQKQYLSQNQVKITQLESKLEGLQAEIQSMKQKQYRSTLAKHQLLPDNPQRKIICFSGFEDKIQLSNRVLQLGGLVSNSKSGSDPRITHFVTLPNSCTLKTMVGSVTGRWILSPEWILMSFESGEWLDENEFGTRNNKEVGIITRKCFYIDSSFDRGLIKDLKPIIWSGGGSFVMTKEEADYLLVGDQNTERHQNPAKFLRWCDFVKMISVLNSSI
eukprot:TRINITY_DN7429_c0_g1_i1.p1 TRINITY_DN7429_c0_g1~~TRINITY_DN7429_c0_g1_i1.p1  ORF type:complete len:272 (-),score=67.78 TRINITY_DN7429_c0_g1_i1:16-831(-)